MPWPEDAARWVAVRFARRTGQPLSEVLQMHPRDMATWMQADEQEAQDARFAQMHGEG